MPPNPLERIDSGGQLDHCSATQKFFPAISKVADNPDCLFLRNIVSHVGVFPVFKNPYRPCESWDSENISRCRCFVSFSCGDAVFLLIFCGVAVLRTPQCPPQQGKTSQFLKGTREQGPPLLGYPQGISVEKVF